MQYKSAKKYNLYIFSLSVKFFIVLVVSSEIQTLNKIPRQMLNIYPYLTNLNLNVKPLCNQHNI